MTADTFLYLSAADVEGLELDPGLMRAAIVEAFQAHHAHLAKTRPKLTLAIGPGHAFQSMCAAWPAQGLAANKWLGMANVAPGSGMPAIHSMIALNDYATGQLRAIMDGNLVTALRTAAMSAAAAQFMARPDSRSIGFIGCGLQARSHLAAFRALLPGLAELHAFSRTRRSAEALVAGASGLRGAVHDDPAAVVRASDVVVTSVPMESGFQPFLDPAWIKPGGFVSSVDVGRSWLPDHLRALDVLAVDDHSQQADSPPIAPGLGPLGSFDADLAQLAAGSKPGRRRVADRTMFVFRGFGLADLAVAALAFRAAQQRGSGAVLPTLTALTGVGLGSQAGVDAAFLQASTRCSRGLPRMALGTLDPSMFRTPSILLSGEVGYPMYEQFRDQFSASLDNELVVIELSTLGGDPEVARMMGEDVRFHSELQPDKRFVFLGKAAIYSAGTTFMSFFAKPNRYLTRGTRLMIHERKLSKKLQIEGPLTTCIATVQATLNEIQASIEIQNEGFENLIRGSRVTMEEVLRRAPSNWYVEAQEAQELGLVEAVSKSQAGEDRPS